MARMRKRTMVNPGSSGDEQRPYVKGDEFNLLDNSSMKSTEMEQLRSFCRQLLECLECQVWTLAYIQMGTWWI